MAVDIYLNPTTGDIDLVDGIMRLTSNIEESSRQQVLISLSGYKGEWVFNIEAFIPWLANDNNPIQLLGAGNNKALIDTLVKEDILGRENITQLVSYTSSLNKATRQMSISFTAKTNSGEVISVEELPLV